MVKKSDECWQNKKETTLIEHNDYDNQQQNGENEKRWIDGETLQGRIGRTWNGLDVENERERGATDDSQISSLSNWMDEMSFIETSHPSHVKRTDTIWGKGHKFQFVSVDSEVL